MNRINNWSRFVESLQTPLTEVEKDEIGTALINSCRTIWGPIHYNFVTNHGLTIRGEILRLSKNNRLLINYVNSIIPSTKLVDMIDWIKQNEMDLYHPNGQYFDKVIEILTNSYNRGRSLEDKGKDVLIEYFYSMGIQIKPFNSSRKRDEEGYDLFWSMGNGVESAQIKTLDSKSSGKLRDFVNCKGHLKKLVTNYLVAINDKECYIYKTKNQWVSPEYFSFPSSNLVYHKVF